MKVDNKVVLLTGCNSGLGLSLATKFYQLSRYHVIVTARQHAMEEMKLRFPETHRFCVRELDVTENSQIHPIVDEICSRWGKLDVLINNAGVCFRSVVEHMDPEAEMLQLKTNYLGPMHIIRTVLPVMREQRRGQIINISSASGSIAMPTMGSYSASKHALEAASEALWYEARPFGIRVSVVLPGFIQSAAHQNVILPKKAKLSSDLGGPHAEFYMSMTPFIAALMRASRVNYDQVAEQIIKITKMKNPPLVNVATPDARVLRFLKRLLPSEFFHLFMFRLLPGSKTWGGKEMPKVPLALATFKKNWQTH